jgi:hypothetical protein
MALAASAMLSGPMLATPIETRAAQQNQVGVVNVAVGHITIQDVNVGVAAQIAATACNLVDVGPVFILAQQVDNTGKKEVVCKTDAGKVVLTQA